MVTIKNSWYNSPWEEGGSVTAIFDKRPKKYGIYKKLEA